MAPTVQAVLFDIDDTLVDTRGAFADAVGAVRRAFLPHVPQEREPELLAIWRDDVGGHYAAYTRGELGFDEQRRRRADELHAAFGGPPVDEAAYPGWLEVFWGQFSASWRAFDDVAPALKLLADGGIKVGCVTNARSGLQEEKLAAAGLADVPVLVGVERFGFGKPRPEVFLEGCRLLGTDPAHTVYVGDEPQVDARGAAEAGLVGVWLDRPGTRRGSVDHSIAAGVHRIQGLDDLPLVLAFL